MGKSVWLEFQTEESIWKSMELLSDYREIYLTNVNGLLIVYS